MMNSPWAAFTTFVTPQTRLRPCAMAAKTKPRRTPYTRDATTVPTSGMSLPRSRSTARVWVLQGRHGDSRRPDALQGRRLPLADDHRVGDLAPGGVYLELPKERHQLHRAEFGPDLGRVQAVGCLDRMGEDED